MIYIYIYIIIRSLARGGVACPLNVLERALLVPADRPYARCVWMEMQGRVTRMSGHGGLSDSDGEDSDIPGGWDSQGGARIGE